MPITNIHNVPEAIVKAVGESRTPKPNRYSATDLTAPAFQRRLKEQYGSQITQDVSEMIYMLMGTAFHLLAEKNATEGILSEYRVEMKYKDVTLAGVIDCYDTVKKEIIDYKTMSVNSMMHKAEPKDEWVKQLNVYRMMLESEGKEVKKMTIIGMARDWSSAKTKFDKEYPKSGFAQFDIPKIDVEAMIDDYLYKYNNMIPCTMEERWAIPDKWAVIKKGVKRAIKIHGTKEEAEKHAKNGGPDYKIEIRPGSCNRCDSYCNCASVCPVKGFVDEDI